ncbi:hypothetical protein [Streptomyces sp. NPDC058045]
MKPGGDDARTGRRLTWIGGGVGLLIALAIPLSSILLYLVLSFIAAVFD